MSVVEVPLRGDIGAYAQDTDLDLIAFNLSLRFNARMARWVLDIADADGVILRAGIPVQTDYPLWYKHVARIAGFPPGQLFVFDETGQQRNPDRETLGGEIKAIYIEEAGA